MHLVKEVYDSVMKISKNRFLQGFGLSVVFLGFIRCLFPSIAGNRTHQMSAEKIVKPTIKTHQKPIQENINFAQTRSSLPVSSVFFKADGSVLKNRIYSVPNFGKAFPDQNDVQLLSAKALGVTPVKDRADAENRKGELVYIGGNPYYYIDNLKSSIPYLVPKAAILLHDIGHNFFDSLQIKGIPLHKIIITSVMRSKDDVQRLRSHNGNATVNSCHLYGTTVDICYNRYKTVEAPNEKRRVVRNDTLKWILSEVLNDMRKQNRCHIKYEVHQGCFHLTVK